MSGGKINFNHHQYFQYIFLNLPVKSCSLQSFGQLEGLKKIFFGDFLQALEDPEIDKPKEFVFNFEQAFLGHKVGMCGQCWGWCWLGWAGWLQGWCPAGAPGESRGCRDLSRGCSFTHAMVYPWHRASWYQLGAGRAAGIRAEGSRACSGRGGS